ncbi:MULTISPECIES: hypothetical protein [Chryseobacterium]|uniref:hypothetical protein n=1 Tax=Chryseobacterium TaxID=59732 RepID=UPI0009D8F53C|nr:MULTISPECIES: hypothetical protein [Chryseobacterium]MDC8099114.1 hypothetical protein [Chryseobacterium rhizosphaerae]SMC45335.1 hypothetical protein SAMN02787074_1193 [Chryseobacterium sp. YR221]
MNLKGINEKVQDMYSIDPKTFSKNNNDNVSSILLFKDYIFRLKTWKDVLNIEYVPFGKSLNLDRNNLLTDINSEWNDGMIPYSHFSNHLSEHLNISIPQGRIQNSLFIYLFAYWEIYKNDLQILQIMKENPQLSHPYEGIIKMFRNDYIYTMEGINISGITMRNSSMNLILPSIEDSFLEYIDLECQLTGSDGIPNQEKVNELWQHFQSL